MRSCDKVVGKFIGSHCVSLVLYHFTLVWVGLVMGYVMLGLVKLGSS